MLWTPTAGLSPAVGQFQVKAALLVALNLDERGRFEPGAGGGGGGGGMWL